MASLKPPSLMILLLASEIAHHRAPVDALQVLERDLARTEAVNLHPVLEGIESFGGALVQFGQRQHNLILALQPFGEGLFHLHGSEIQNSFA
jgi:hypothetical protein